MLCAFYSLTTKSEYHYKGREPYKESIHTQYYTLFNTFPPTLSYTLELTYFTVAIYTLNPTVNTIRTSYITGAKSFIAPKPES